MSEYDICIIGGGISGLYTAYKLINKGYNIILLEGSSRFGGRIHTYKTKEYLYEMGAGRICETNKYLMKLINELNLNDKLHELSHENKIVLKNKNIKDPQVYKYLKKIIDGSKMYTKKYLISINFLQLCINILGFEKACDLRSMLAYDSEFNNLNAYACLKMYKNDLLIKNKYYILTCGLEVIIEKIIEKISPFVKLNQNAFVKEISERSLKYTRNEQNHSIHFKKCISCIPVNDLCKIQSFKDMYLKDKIKAVPLLRIYAKYPLQNGKVWFHDLPRVITDNYIRFIIPIDPKNGIIMISYTDSMYAEMWNNMSKNGNKCLYSELHDQIKNILNINPPKPIFIRSYYWNEGFHNWNPSYDMNKEYNLLCKPFENKEIYLCNESFSKKQGWIEGCLEMSHDILRLMNNEQKGGKKDKIPIFKSLDEIIKKKNWIIFKRGKKLKIYDVSKWLSRHPGGTSALKEGIKANNFYYKMGKDPKYPKSPIQVFNEITSHKRSDVLNTYLPIKYNIENEKSGVSLVGLFKIK
tara:strand:+ start:783 stop:2357 length:1575 start_codon:yes stop_codon:yes gene_type:complete